MIRFILKRSHSDRHTGAEWTQHETFIADVPILERALLQGGRGPDGYDLTELVGVEIIVPSHHIQHSTEGKG